MTRNLNRRFRTPGRLLERNLQIVPEIRAALRAAATAPAAEEIAEAEHVAQDVAQVAELREDRWVEPGASTRGGAHARVAEAIVETSLLRVGEDGVRLGALLEFLFGELVARVAVRMELHRQPAVRALDFGVARGLGDLEHFVVVALAHAFATFTIAGRSRRSLSM